MEGFIDRLEKIRAHYELGISGLAEAIGVQRSSISHILKGRNKPSLDMVLKLLDAFPEVDFYWLIKGSGDFPKSAHSSGPLEHRKTETPPHPINASQKEIERMVIFYTDGTFSSYREHRPDI